MKKQINPSIKAHLLRSALILLSLFAICAIPFALAQSRSRGTNDRSVANHQSKMPAKSSAPLQTPTPTPTGTPSPSATASCFRPPPGQCVSFEAEADNNTLGGSAFVLSCPTCSGRPKVGYVGSNSGTLTFNAVGVVAPGNHTVTICYLNGDATRYALLSVNGGSGMPVSFPSTGSFQTVGSIQKTVTLNTGCNTLEFYNPV